MPVDRKDFLRREEGLLSRSSLQSRGETKRLSVVTLRITRYTCTNTILAIILLRHIFI